MGKGGVAMVRLRLNMASGYFLQFFKTFVQLLYSLYVVYKDSVPNLYFDTILPLKL